MKKKRLVIFDSNSIIHRAFHAIPPLTTKKGELVNAIYGFLLVFFKAIREFQPDYLVACFDFPAKTFRHIKYKEYKITRPPAPKELYQQIPKIKETLKSFDVAIFEKEGFEADDLIATIVNLSRRQQQVLTVENIIISGDADILQLVNRDTHVYLLTKRVKDIVLYGKKEVQERYQGLRPEQLLDFKALKGDPSDNIPGIPGIGEKTALNLIQEFGSLKNIYQNLPLVPEKIRKKLINYKEQAFLSRDLVQIKKNVPIEFDLENCQWRDYDKTKIIHILENLEFYSLIKRLPN